MNINELQPGKGDVELTAKIIEKSEARTFEKYGNQGTVCKAKIKDDSGTVTLTLWNEQVDQVNVGDTIKITNGWVGEWQGEPQLSTGKFGKLEVTNKEEQKNLEIEPEEVESVPEKEELASVEEQYVPIKEEKVE